MIKHLVIYTVWVPYKECPLLSSASSIKHRVDYEVVGRTFRQGHENHLHTCRGFSTSLGLRTHALLSTMLTAAIELAPTGSTSRQITA